MRLDLLLTQLKLFASKINMNGKVRKEKVHSAYTYIHTTIESWSMGCGLWNYSSCGEVVMVNISRTEL